MTTIHGAWRVTKSVGRQCVQAFPLVIGGIRAVRNALSTKHIIGALNDADVDQARTSPWKVFRSPQEVTKHDELSTHDKKEILSAWEEDATRLATAEGEGMGGGEPNRLSDVTDAKRKLTSIEGEQPQSEVAAPKVP